MNLLPRLYNWYRLMHPRHAKIARHARRSASFRKRAWQWPEAQRREWIQEALRAALSSAMHVPFYRDRLEKAGINPGTATFDDFSRVPPLEREDLAKFSDQMRLMTPGAPGVIRDSTGGSTGTPAVVWKGPVERAWGEGGVAFADLRFGVPFGARTGLLWGHHLDARSEATWLDRVRDARDNVHWFDAFRLSPEVLSGYHKELNRLRPDVIVAYAGALYELARAVKQEPVPPEYPRIAFVTGAEKVHPHERRLIESVFGRPIFERYGSRDVGMLAFQSSADPATGFEVDWPNLLVEPESEAPESAILVTKLHADAFPMIRYRIGDLARFPAGSLPGHPTFRLHEILGRELEKIRVGPDQWLSGTNFPHLLKDFPVADFQVYQSLDGHIEVRIVPDDLDSWTDEVRRRLQHAMDAVLGTAPWSLEFVAAIERSRANKRRPVVSELAKSSHA